MEVYDYEGNYLGLGFSLPEGIPIFAVKDGLLTSTYIGGSKSLDGNWTYISGYRLLGIDADALPDTSFHYDQSGFNTVFPNPKVLEGELILPESWDSIWVNGGQELGRVVTIWTDTGYSVGFDVKGEVLGYFNLIFAVEHKDDTACQLHLNP